MALKNLGLVKAVFTQATAPTPTDVLWYDTGSKLLKYYNDNLALWVPLQNAQLVGALTNNQPTDAEITTIVGLTAAQAGTGFQITIYNTNDGKLYFIESNGVNWYYVNRFNFIYTYGSLYNWYAVDTGLLAPSECHIPTFDEAWDMANFLGGSTVCGGKLKETGLAHWKSPNTGATNETGFTGTGSGLRSSNDGTFSGQLEHETCWTSSSIGLIQKRAFALLYDDIMMPFQLNDPKDGFSVRCIKNSTLLLEGQSGSITDIDNNIYPTKCINGKEWMISKLAVSRYNDGTPIPNVTDDLSWTVLVTGARCWYNNVIL